MRFDFAGIRDKVAVSVLTAMVLGGGALIANWASQGGLVRAIGGVTSKDMETALQPLKGEINSLLSAQSALAEKIKSGETGARISATPVEPAKIVVKEVMLQASPEAAGDPAIGLRRMIKKECDGKATCEFDLSSDSIPSIYSHGVIKVSYYCSNFTDLRIEYGSQGSILLFWC